MGNIPSRQNTELDINIDQVEGAIQSDPYREDLSPRSDAHGVNSFSRIGYGATLVGEAIENQVRDMYIYIYIY